MLQESDTSYLKQMALIKERPFTSQTPLVGPIIVKLRTWFNSISTKWYVRALLVQQNEFNKQIVQTVDQQTQWLIMQDHEKAELTHEVARLTVQITSLNQQVQALESRLSSLENKTQYS